MNTNLPISIHGQVIIQDDLGNILLDKTNAVHPQNMARILARALANESNSFISSIAFGNGGTSVDAAQTVTYRTPNIGQPPDVHTWDSKLYNETYREIIDEGNTVVNPNLGTDPGSANRPGGGSDPSNDPLSVPHVSGPGVRSTEQGIISEVSVTAVINPSEPSGQFANDVQTDTETSFVFDELGLYSGGASSVDTNGYADLDVGEKTSTDDTTLLGNTPYSFNISVDGGLTQEITFITPSTGSGAGGTILYGDLCEALNTGDVTWNNTWAGVSPLPNNATVSITDVSNGQFPSITGAQTYGYLRFSSNTGGTSSSVILTPGTSGNDLIAKLNSPIGALIKDPVLGTNAGIQNDPVNPENERERLITHLTFAPILKSGNRILTITYKLTIAVAKTQS